ncbi:MAG: type II secretion system F family protein [Myxococcales bacterium]|jgi:type IV pilus assembly protein PilC|nr:type II secretion system F family protein [Myxococcales bacterium]
MADFLYEAKNQSGKVITGKISAKDISTAEAAVKAQGLNVVSIKKAPITLSLPSFGGGGVSIKDLKTFTQQFATMIDAGLPLVQVLDILGTQSENKKFGAKILEIKAHVEGGSTFSEALAKYPNIFDTLFVNLVAAGELGGILDTIMRRLSEYIEKNERLIRRVKGAMVYPAGVLTVSIVVVAVLLKWVVPTFENMFADFGKEDELPGPTQVVISLSNWFQDHFIIITVGTIALIVGYRFFVRSPFGREFMDRLFLNAPVIGPVVKKVAVARFTRTLGTLLSSGVPIIDALNTVAKAAGNVVIERAINFARDRISEGRNMSEPLQESRIFPGMVVQMIAVGEQTGALDVMCNKIADFYDEEVEIAIGAMTSLLEPIMMVFLGGVVGGMVIAMYLPIFSIAGTIE